MKRVFPKGCEITNIRRSPRSGMIHAQLRHPEEGLIIAATLDYIHQQIRGGEFVDYDEYLRQTSHA